MYGKEQKEEKKEHARWSLIQEARKYTDLSVGGLHEMYESFAAVAPAGRPAHWAQAEHARVSQAQRSAHEVGAPSVVCVAHQSKQRAAKEKDG